MTNGSELAAETLGIGEAGSVEVIVDDFVDVLSGSRLNARTGSSASAGRVAVTAPNRITVDGSNSQILTEATATGNSGSIEINTRELNVQNSGQISAKNITGTGNQFIKLDGLDILKIRDGLLKLLCHKLVELQRLSAMTIKPTAERMSQ